MGQWRRARSYFCHADFRVIKIVVWYWSANRWLSILRSLRPLADDASAQRSEDVTDEAFEILRVQISEQRPKNYYTLH